jgi:16S rRNA (cytidine1402-2'-O)-methyltransferase
MLFIVSTPIGNLKDITYRAIETLQETDIILCEDTRKTGILLSHYSIKKPLSVLNDFNEKNKVYEVIQLLEDGKNVALVSDSGTPLVSDPGYAIVHEAQKRNIPITVIPGATAFVTALVASGLPTDKFLFLGFLPKAEGKKKNFLQQTKNLVEAGQQNKISSTLIFYETPHRLISTFETLHEVFGNIEIVVARELTKIHESVIKNTVENFIEIYKKEPVRGEYVLLLNLNN